MQGIKSVRTHIIHSLDKFEIYIYNKAEEENSKRNRFLMTFLAMADKKGFEYEMLDEVEDLYMLLKDIKEKHEDL